MKHSDAENRWCAMNASYNGGGFWTMRIDVNCEKVEAPPTAVGERRHYLPCANGCGSVHVVPWNVVSAPCAECDR